MIKIYTDRKYIPTGNMVILDNEAVFRTTNGLKEFVTLNYRHKEYSDLMRFVDGITDLKDGFVSTKFGVTSLDNISTGLKTLMNTIYLMIFDENCVVNLNECGHNVLNIILNSVIKENISFLLETGSLPYFDNIDVLLDDRKHINNYEEFSDYILNNLQ